MQAQLPRLVLPIGHNGRINGLAYSPDGKRVATASGDHTAKIWDAATGALLADLKGFQGSVYKASFSPDGRLLLATPAFDDSLAKIWDATTGAFVGDLVGHSRSLQSGAFSPDGHRIITASADGTARIWDVATRQTVRILKGHRGALKSARFSPDGQRVLTASSDRSARLWDARTGATLAVLNGHTQALRDAVFSEDGRRIATASADSTLRLWDTGGAQLLVLRGHNKAPESVVFSSDGQLLLSYAPNSDARLWDLRTNGTCRVFTVKNSWVNDAQFQPGTHQVALSVYGRFSGIVLWQEDGTEVARLPQEACGGLSFSRDGRFVGSYSWMGDAHLWQIANGQGVPLRGYTDDTQAALFSPDGKTIITSGFRQTKYWDAATGTLKAVLPQTSFGDDLRFLFGPDGATMVLIGYDSIVLVQIDQGKILRRIGGHSMSIHSLALSPDGRRLLSTSEDGTGRVWSLSPDSLLATLTGHTHRVNSGAFSPDGKWVITASDDHTVKVWDAGTGHLMHTLSGHGENVFLPSFSPDGSRIVTPSQDFTARLWNTATGEELLQFTEHEGGVYSAIFSADGKRLLTASGDETAKLWDVQTGRVLADLKGHTGILNLARFSPDEKMVLTASWDGTARLWSTSGKALTQLKGHGDQVYSSVFSPDGKRVLTCSRDQTCRVWNAATGEELYSFLGLDSTGFMLMAAGNYYHATADAARRLHYVTPQLGVVSFEQLDVRYHRPDKVLQAIGIADSSLVSSFRLAYQKRIRKLGIDTTHWTNTGYRMPVADFAGRADLPRALSSDTLRLHIVAMDSVLQLDRWNVWVNEVPLFGARGRTLGDKHRHAFDTVLTIRLGTGSNKIETSVTNSEAVESYRMPLEIVRTGTDTAVRLYFAGIGIDRFRQREHNLRYSVKDIRDLALLLKAKYGRRIQIDTLFNEQVTTERVRALKSRLASSREIDKIILAYSGHGLLSNAYDYFLSTYDVDFAQPQERGLPYDALESLLDSIPARQKLLLIDACHSGEVDKEEATNYLATQAAGPSKKGVELKQVAQGRPNAFELMQQVFVNVGRSTGATIISAAGGMQSALERTDLRNGVFTYALLEFLRTTPSPSVRALKEYVNRRVPEMTEGKQVPTSRAENSASNWVLW
ncbi:caspase family protein [Flaviaesturariibacter aridisoli]|uniref:caspase family protein n=1 Tax=Flaviaesturariibacter aridisoli TaxID=2545761 RepID=UPI001404F135|nr:caspase family protein [Flaviaesturariibacter aridisoli]